MGKDTKIEWTDATFNPWIGCTKVSPGCANCYAEAESKRRGRAKWGNGQPRMRTLEATWKNPVLWNQEAMQSRRRRRVFCASLADVFDEEVDVQWRADLWELVRKTPFLDWLILTKRPENIVTMLPEDWDEGWANVCLMTSVEDQERTSRIDDLLKVPARYRALSMEPLLGPVTLKAAWLKQLDWVIVGGESGGKARPMNPEWVRSLQKQCEAKDVKFFFKQWGCWSPDERFQQATLQNIAYFAPRTNELKHLRGLPMTERREAINQPEGKVFMYHGNKTKTGHKLDGHDYRKHPFGQKILESELVILLSPDERKQLAAHERTIRAGLGTFVAVGSALMQIRDNRLYRATHPTFEAYVQSVLALSRPRAYELIDSSQVMQDLSGIPDIQLPQNEAQATELRQWKTPEERIEKWKAVVAAAEDQPMTAKFIRETLHPRQDDDQPKTRSERAKELLDKVRALLAESPIKTKALALITKLEGLLSD